MAEGMGSEGDGDHGTRFDGRIRVTFPCFRPQPLGQLAKLVGVEVPALAFQLVGQLVQLAACLSQGLDQARHGSGLSPRLSPC